MKKTLTGIGLVIIALSIWYLFIKPYDYLVKFTEKAPTGYIYNVIREWNSSIENSTIVNTNRYSELQQHIKTEGHNYILNWKIKYQNDSISGIRLYVTEPEHSLINRISVALTESEIEKFSKEKGIDLKKAIEANLSKSTVQTNGEQLSPAKFCACVKVKSVRKDKAKAMIANKHIVPEFLEMNRIPITSYPLLEIESWDQQTDSITFNFCFPVKKSDSLPVGSDIFYKEFQATPSLKSTFHGHYGLSDKAWFALLDYAQARDIRTTGLPMELFYNNPHNGENELEWKAEVFMPLKTGG